MSIVVTNGSSNTSGFATLEWEQLPVPVQQDGRPVVYRMDPWSRIDVATLALQEGVLVRIGDEDEPRVRAIAEIYARC